MKLGKLLPNNKVEQEWSGQGFIYYDTDAFEKKEGICYVPEHGVDDEDNIEVSYTYDDFIRLAAKYRDDEDNNIDKKEFSVEYIANYLFEVVDWQMVETLITELEMHDSFVAA